MLLVCLCHYLFGPKPKTPPNIEYWIKRDHCWPARSVIWFKESPVVALKSGYFNLHQNVESITQINETANIQDCPALVISEYSVSCYSTKIHSTGGPCYIKLFLCVFVFSVPLSAAKNMIVYDETSSTMRVRWEEAAGATGYMLRYKSINATEPQVEGEVKSFFFQILFVRLCV